MARTKASVGGKIASGKSSKARCSVAPSTSAGVSSGSKEKKSRGSGGGNPVCPRETPKWQKSITNFFGKKDNNDSRESNGDDEVASTLKPKRNIIESDEEASPEKPKNNVLDETIELEELTGENSHKIEEYYPKAGKGKGVGKKTKKATKIKDVSNEEDIDDKETQNVNENGMEISTHNDDKKESEIGGKGKEDAKQNKETEPEDAAENSSENIDKENMNNNIDMKETNNKKSDRDSNIMRSKRERDTLDGDGNVNKKIKVK